MRKEQRPSQWSEDHRFNTVSTVRPTDLITQCHRSVWRRRRAKTKPASPASSTKLAAITIPPLSEETADPPTPAPGAPDGIDVTVGGAATTVVLVTDGVDVVVVLAVVLVVVLDVAGANVVVVEELVGGGGGSVVGGTVVDVVDVLVVGGGGGSVVDGTVVDVVDVLVVVVGGAVVVVVRYVVVV